MIFSNIITYIFFLSTLCLILFDCNKSRIKLASKRSQFNQDLSLFYHYYQNVVNGFFIEIGAFDGLSLSNTYFFEKNFYWKGILIEGGEENCKKLKKNTHKRSNAIIICEPICKYRQVNYVDNGYLGSITYTNKTNNKRKCNTLKNITQYYKIKHIDLFSLDVEGSELEVLETFDFSVSVSHWLIEWNHLSKEIKTNITKILNNNGYYLDRGKYISPIDIVFSKIK